MDLREIPRVIHTVWLSGEAFPTEIEDCIAVCRRLNPEFGFRVWGAGDVLKEFSTPPDFYFEAFEGRKWAFATDWLRLAILRKYGGIYIDSDVRCHKSFDGLLRSAGFIGWESSDLLGPHTIGASPNHRVIEQWLGLYENRHFEIRTGIFDQTPMPDIVTDYSVSHLGLVRSGDDQTLLDDFSVYAPNILTSKIDDKCVAEHLYFGGWLPASSHSFASNLAKRNYDFLKSRNGSSLKRAFSIPLSKILRRRREKTYQRAKESERKKSLVLIEPVTGNIPRTRFWHIGTNSKPRIIRTGSGTSPKISVVVPVYNVERYLDTCLNSLRVQDYDTAEFILVNDGSTDKSLKICERYAAVDSRFQVFSKPNSGLGGARNFGLEKVSGDAVCFVDSDDYLSRNHLSSMAQRLTPDVDVAICNHQKVLPDGRYLSSHNTGHQWQHDDPILHLLMGEAECYAWNKLYRRSIFDFEPFRFGSGWFEDFAIIPALLSSINSVAYTSECTYHYVQRPDSILASTRANPTKNLDIIDAARHLISLQPVFKPTHWLEYYEWKLILHVLYWRWAPLDSIVDPGQRNEAQGLLARFLNREIPGWHETSIVKERVTRGTRASKLNERKLVEQILSFGK